MVNASRRHATLGTAQLSICYALALFHRTCAAVVALAMAAQTGTDASHYAPQLAAVFFGVYALMQIPSGLLADTFGALRLASVGSLVTGAGALAFGLSSDFPAAIVARGVMAAGCAVVFVCLMRYIKLNWPAERTATIGGRAILVGNLGAVASAAPLAWLLTIADWRDVHIGLGTASIVLAGGLRTMLRDTREPQAARIDASAVLHELHAVLANPWNHLGFLVLAGLAGSYLALAGCWALPLLQERGIPRDAAIWFASALIASYACGACFLGWLADRLRDAALVLAGACAGAALCWAALLSQDAPGARTAGSIVVLLGFCCGGFNLVYGLIHAKNPAAHVGTVTAYVNMGIFAGAGALQWATSTLIERSAGFNSALTPMCVASLFALVLSSALVRPRGGGPRELKTAPGATR